MAENDTEPRVDDKTLTFIVEHTKNAADKQLSDVDSMDAKANGIFAVASAVIGLAGLSAAVSGTVTRSATGEATTVSLDSPLLVTIALVGALLAYLYVSVSTVAAWWLRQFKRSDYAMTLWQEHWSDNPTQIKTMVAAGIPGIFAYNSSIIQKKATWISHALIACSVEVALVGLAVVIQST